jgi:3-deoxy-D-manno-oct-2-ulosonic acid (Kdo) hydroxylase
MPVCAIALSALREGKPPTVDQARAWCERLEAGEILYFPETPVPIPADDLRFLLEQRQTGSGLHKNIAYKPVRDQLSGVDEKSTSAAEVEQLRAVMRRYSAGVTAFLKDFLAPYEQRWLLDYASFRPLEEQGRDLALRKRNDMLHTDAFPTRPTRGRRILRFFHNIHPTRTRDWVVSEPFARVVGVFAPGRLAIPHADGPVAGAGKRLAQAVGLAGIVPQLKRTPYDQFMMELHNAMKENAEFQRDCVKESVQFPPGSSWMVYTETVPHAVLAGQYALEQTYLVDRAAMVTPESAPVAILEKLAGKPLV